MFFQYFRRPTQGGGFRHFFVVLFVFPGLRGFCTPHKPHKIAIQEPHPTFFLLMANITWQPLWHRLMDSKPLSQAPPQPEGSETGLPRGCSFSNFAYRCDPSRHLQESPGPQEPEIAKESQKGSFWGSGEKSQKIPEKSLKIPKKYPKRSENRSF